MKYPAQSYPLWNPNPGELEHPFEVGDVGFIREGKFHHPFSAMLTEDYRPTEGWVTGYHIMNNFPQDDSFNDLEYFVLWLLP